MKSKESVAFTLHCCFNALAQLMGLETGIDGVEIKDPSGITKDGRCVERLNSVLSRKTVKNCLLL